MKADDEITITGELAASSICNANLNINKDAVTIACSGPFRSPISVQSDH